MNWKKYIEGNNYCNELINQALEKNWDQEYEEANELLNESINKSNELIDDYPSLSSSFNVNGRSYFHLAKIAKKQDKKEKAIEYYLEAIKKYDLGLENKYEKKSNLYSNKADCLYELFELKKELDDQENLLKIANNYNQAIFHNDFCGELTNIGIHTYAYRKIVLKKLKEMKE